eukprot:1918485-Prymnesium_polylepis.1
MVVRSVASKFKIPHRVWSGPPARPLPFSQRSLVLAAGMRCARKRPCGNCGRMSMDETSNIVRQCDRTAAAYVLYKHRYPPKSSHTTHRERSTQLKPSPVELGGR